MMVTVGGKANLGGAWVMEELIPDLRLMDLWSPVRRQRNKRELVGVLHNW